MKRTLILFVLCLLVCVISPVLLSQNTEYISETGMSQRALFKYLERCRDQDANRVLSLPKYTISTADIQTGANLQYLIDGVGYTVVATTTMPFSAAAQATTTKQLYLFCYNSSGVATCVAGVAVDAATTTPLTFSVDPELPDVPTGYLPVAYLEATVATCSFTLGTSSLATDDYVISITEISILDHLGEDNYRDL